VDAFDGDEWPEENQAQQKTNLRDILGQGGVEQPKADREVSPVERKSVDRNSGGERDNHSMSDRKVSRSRSRSPHSRSRSNGGYRPRRNSGGRRSRSRSHSRERVDKRDVNPDTFTQVYISRLERRSGESDVEQAFSKFGKVKSITMKNFYAFVDYETHEAAVLAIAEMNNTTFVNGEPITVQQSSMY